MRGERVNKKVGRRESEEKERKRGEICEEGKRGRESRGRLRERK